MPRPPPNPRQAHPGELQEALEVGPAARLGPPRPHDRLGYLAAELVRRASTHRRRAHRTGHLVPQNIARCIDDEAETGAAASALHALSGESTIPRPLALVFDELVSLLP